MAARVNDQIAFLSQAKRLKLNRLATLGLALWSAMVISQWLWWLERQDTSASILTLAGGLIGVRVFFKRNLMAAYPISTTMMLGYVSYYFLLPPLATFLEGKPLSNNLHHPALVLLHAFVSLLFLMGAYTIYRHSNILKNLRWFVTRKIYQPSGFFQAPSNLHFLVMGSIGLIAMGFQIFIVGVYQDETLGIGSKFMQGFYPLAYLPYIILVKKVTGQYERFSRKWLLIILGYTILIIFVSVGRNSRAAFLIGVASIILAYLYGLVVGLYTSDHRVMSKITLAIIGAILISGPTADLALSMVVVRGARTNISAIDLVSETIKVFQDKDTLLWYRPDAFGNRSFWDEWYVDNLFMARLCNLKFADNSIDLALLMGEATKSYIREIEFQRVLAFFPRPLIKAFGLPVDKDLVEAASSGDFMFYAVSGNPYALGGYRTGSIFGNGYTMFGWWYPLIFAGLLILVFPLADSLTSRTSVTTLHKYEGHWVPILSPVAIIGFFTWFFYLTSAATAAESLSDLVGYLIRGWIQNLFVYALVYWITIFPLKMTSRAY